MDVTNREGWYYFKKHNVPKAPISLSTTAVKSLDSTNQQSCNHSEKFDGCGTWELRNEN